MKNHIESKKQYGDQLPNKSNAEGRNWKKKKTLINEIKPHEFFLPRHNIFYNLYKIVKTLDGDILNDIF